MEEDGVDDVEMGAAAAVEPPPAGAAGDEADGGWAGIELGSDYDSGDVEDAEAALGRVLSCVQLRVTTGGSPLVVDEAAVVTAFLEERLGGREAREVKVGVFTSLLALRHEADRTWPVLSLQFARGADFMRVMRAFGAPGLADEGYDGFREVALGEVYLPGCGQRRAVTVAYCREKHEQSLPGAPDLGVFVGEGLLVTLCVPNTLGLDLDVRAYNKVTCALVMGGSCAAKSYDGAGKGDAWAKPAAGVQRQLAVFGLSGAVSKVSDKGSPRHQCGAMPWRLPGSVLTGAYRGAKLEVRVVHQPERVAAGTVEPGSPVGAFRLRGLVGWGWQVKPRAGGTGREWETRLCSVEMKPEVASGSGYEVVRLEDAEGAVWYQVSPRESSAVLPPGYAAVARPARAPKRAAPEHVVNAVRMAVRGAGAAAAEAAGQGAACGMFLERAAKAVLRAGKSDKDWRLQLPAACEAIFDLRGGAGRKLMCEAGACCRQERFPCAQFFVAAKAAMVGSLREVRVAPARVR